MPQNPEKYTSNGKDIPNKGGMALRPFDAVKCFCFHLGVREASNFKILNRNFYYLENLNR